MDTGKWLAGPQEISGNAGASPARPKMFCFPHAGGGASFYRNWERNLRGLADVRAVQLPGREERFREPRYYSIHRLADALFEAEEGRGWVDGACILFGHSMGAKIAFEVARRLVLQGRPPALLLVSGSRPVHMPPRKLLSDLPDEAFDAELRQLAGTPEEILREPDLMRMFRPLLRADFAMEADYSAGSELEQVVTELIRRIRATHDLSVRHARQVRRADERLGENMPLDIAMRGGLEEEDGTEA